MPSHIIKCAILLGAFLALTGCGDPVTSCRNDLKAGQIGPDTLETCLKAVAEAPESGIANRVAGIAQLKVGDHAAAKVLLERGVELKDPYAAAWLGGMYHRGEGVPRNVGKACALFEQAEALKHPDSGNLVDIGNCYLDEESGRTDSAKAMEYYQRAAKLGDVDAMNDLGVIYDRGKLVPRDPQKAMDYYKQAAAKGDSLAKVNLSASYLNDEGIPVNRPEAKRLLAEAAKAGDEWGKFNYALILVEDAASQEELQLAKQYLDEVKASAEYNTTDYPDLPDFYQRARLALGELKEYHYLAEDALLCGSLQSAYSGAAILRSNNPYAIAKVLPRTGCEQASTRMEFEPGKVTLTSLENGFVSAKMPGGIIFTLASDWSVEYHEGPQLAAQR